MTRFYVAVALSTLLLSSLSQAVSAQGISEYGAALGAGASNASAASHGAGAARSATQGLYNNAAGSLQGVSGGDKGATSSGGQNQMDQDLAPLYKQKLDENGQPMPIDPRATVLSVGKMSNKMFADAQMKEKQGKLLEAEQLYMRAIRLRSRFWGDKDPAVLKMYTIVGKLEMKRGFPDTAEAFFKRALQASLKRYGTGSFENCDFLEALGDSCYGQKKYDEAGNYYKQVHDMKERKLGTGNAQTISALVKQANSYARSSEKGYWPDAEDLLKNVLPIAEAVPNNKPQVVAILDGYHYVLEKEGKNDLADTVLTKLTDLRVPQATATAPASVPATDAPGAPAMTPPAPTATPTDKDSAPPAKAETKSAPAPKK